MGILIVVLIVFALTGIVAAVWGFVRPPPEGPGGPRRPGPGTPEQKEP